MVRPRSFSPGRSSPNIDREGRGNAGGASARRVTFSRTPRMGTLEHSSIATGSEVEIALEAQARLLREGIRCRLVSMPCWELFEAQSADYRESVLPEAISVRVSIEAGTTFGWSRYVGSAGIAIGVNRYGASAPGEVIYEKLGLVPDAVTAAVKSLLER